MQHLGDQPADGQPIPPRQDVAQSGAAVVDRQHAQVPQDSPFFTHCRGTQAVLPVISQSECWSIEPLFGMSKGPDQEESEKRTDNEDDARARAK